MLAGRAVLAVVNNRRFNCGVAPVNVSLPISPFGTMPGEGVGSGHTAPTPGPRVGVLLTVSSGATIGPGYTHAVTLQTLPKPAPWWRGWTLREPGGASERRDSHSGLGARCGPRGAEPSCLPCKQRSPSDYQWCALNTCLLN